MLQNISGPNRARSAWLNIMLWCAQQENGGRIEQARDWKDRQWQQTCGVTRREVDSAERLLQWDGEALIVYYGCSSEPHRRPVSPRPLVLTQPEMLQ